VRRRSLNDEHRAFLAGIVDKGLIPAVHGVVRWRACDLIMQLYEEFGISLSDDTVYRALKAASHASAPDREPTSRMARRSRYLKKLPRSRGENPQQPCTGHADRGVVLG
jgi:transposase